MNYSLNLRIYIYIYISISLICVTYAQYGTTYNYINVNTQAFTVPPSFMGNNNQDAYNMSILDMSQRLSAIYKNGMFYTDYNINTLIKVKKIKFSSDSIRMLIIQPIYSPTLKKRCVLMSPGNGESFSNWYLSNRYAVDFALRGYVVAYYENSGSKNPNLNNSGKNTDTYFADKVINPCCVAPNNSIRDKFFSSMFVNLFISNAARKYIVNNSTILNVDTTKFFLAGGSLGANTALFYGYGCNNNWSTNSYYTCVKNMLNYPDTLSNAGVKGIMSMGGGLPAPTEALGDIITNIDYIPSIWFAGAGDIAVNPNESDILGPVIWGALSMKNELTANSINNNMYLNCFGVHSFESPAYDDPSYGEWTNSLPTNTISGNTNPPFNTTLNLSQVTNYKNAHQQKLNYYQYTEHQSYQALVNTSIYFNNIINNSIPSNLVNYIRPTQLQNSPFYKYSIGGYTLEQAVLSYYTCQKNEPLCIFAGAHEYDNIAKNNLNSTFLPSNECNVLANNFGAEFNSNNSTYSTSRLSKNLEINSENLSIEKLNIILLDNNHIELKIPKTLVNSSGTLNFYNILGLRVGYQNEFKINEEQNLIFDISQTLHHLPNGIYFCVVQLSNATETLKIVHNR